jgi:hypothetical protein
VAAAEVDRIGVARDLDPGDQTATPITNPITTRSITAPRSTAD